MRRQHYDRDARGNAPEIPYFNRTILTARNKPLPFAMEAYGRDIVVVSLKHDKL